jgi:cell division protein FtsB
MQAAVKKENEWTQTRPSGQRTVKMQGKVAYISSDIVGYTRPETGVKTTPKTPAKTVARPAVKKSVRPAVKAAAKPSAKADTRSRTGFISTLIVLLVAFGALAVLVSRYAAVCSIGTQNNALEKSIAVVEAQMDELQLKIEMDDDLQKVQEEAVGELGMIYPTPEQKISIDTAANGE